jgi:hypothetical protein
MDMGLHIQVERSLQAMHQHTVPVILQVDGVCRLALPANHRPAVA